MHLYTSLSLSLALALANEAPTTPAQNKHLGCQTDETCCSALSCSDGVCCLDCLFCGGSLVLIWTNPGNGRRLWNHCNNTIKLSQVQAKKEDKKKKQNKKHLKRSLFLCVCVPVFPCVPPPTLTSPSPLPASFCCQLVHQIAACLKQPCMSYSLWRCLSVAAAAACAASAVSSWQGIAPILQKHPCPPLQPPTEK